MIPIHPTQMNLQMRAQVIRLRKPKDWGPIFIHTPEKAKIARERKLQTNPAGKSRSTRGQSDPKLSSWQRVQEHKNEYLTSVDGKLRCDACKETISKKKSTVKKHISSLKHVKAKKIILESKKKDQNCYEEMIKQSILKEKHYLMICVCIVLT